MNNKQVRKPRIGASWWIVVILLGFVALPFALAIVANISDDQFTHSVLAGQLRDLFTMPEYVIVAIIGTLALAGLAFAKSISWKVAGFMMLLAAAWPMWLWIGDDVVVQERTTGAVVAIPGISVQNTQGGTSNQALILAAAIAIAGILMILVGLRIDRRRASGGS